MKFREYLNEGKTDFTDIKNKITKRYSSKYDISFENSMGKLKVVFKDKKLGKFTAGIVGNKTIDKWEEMIELNIKNRIKFLNTPKGVADEPSKLPDDYKPSN